MRSSSHHSTAMLTEPADETALASPAWRSEAGSPQPAKGLLKVIFFWDYDTQWGADRSRAGAGAKDWGMLDFQHTERLLELHQQFDVPACFAVVGAAARPGKRPYHDPAQIRRIHEAGHEVASHSLYHDWLPGLFGKQLDESLQNSKDALEQCIQAPVVSFVPPYNQPFDYPRGWSISLAERREAGAQRTDLRRLCEALHRAGYGFCRVAYRPLYQRLARSLFKRRCDLPRRVQMIGGIKCLRLNTPDGFAGPVQERLQSFSRFGGYLVVHAHPHALSSRNSQDERWLVPFLQQLNQLRQMGRACVCLPRDLVVSQA